MIRRVTVCIAGIMNISAYFFFQHHSELILKVPFTTENVIFDPNSCHLFDGSSVRPNTLVSGILLQNFTSNRYAYGARHFYCRARSR